MTRKPPTSVDDLTAHKRRIERLLEAFWTDAMAGDQRAGELCRRLLAQQGELYGFTTGAAATTPTSTAPDELAKLRARRAVP